MMVFHGASLAVFADGNPAWRGRILESVLSPSFDRFSRPGDGAPGYKGQSLLRGTM